MAPILPFRINVPEADIADLRKKLERTKFPDELDDAGWGLGSPLADVRRLTAHWRDKFDWRSQETALNKLPQFTTEVEVPGFDKLRIHFVHQKSPVDEAVPLLFIHGCTCALEVPLTRPVLVVT